MSRASEKAVRFAQRLGVDSVYTAAKQFQDQVTETGKALVDLRAQKRTAEELLSMIEIDLISDERGKHPEMSAAAMDKHLKVVFSKDKSHIAKRDEIRNLQYAIDQHEITRSNLIGQVNIESARLIELGGYLHYLAAVREASTDYEASEASAT